jgi:hypothetical protein
MQAAIMLLAVNMICRTSRMFFVWFFVVAAISVQAYSAAYRFISATDEINFATYYIVLKM